MPFVTDSKGAIAEAPPDVAAVEYAKTSPGYGGFVSAFDTAENPTSMLMQRAEQSAYREHDWFRTFLAGNAAAYGANITADDMFTPSPKITAEEANKQYPNPVPGGKPLFSDPIESKLAETIHKQRTQTYQAETDIQRFEANHSWPVNAIASVPAMLTDPLNLSLAFMPGFGEEALASRVGIGIAGRTLSRLAVGAELGAIQQAPISALKLGLADDLHSDYDIRRALLDTLMGTAVGAGLNAGFGAAIDPFRYMAGTLPSQQAARAATRLDAPAVATAPAQTNYAAAQSAISQIVSGRPVDVADFFPRARSDTAVNLFMNHPFMERIEPTDINLSPREVAASIEPKHMAEVERIETERTNLASQYQALAQQRQAQLGQGQGLIVDQINQLEQQLKGKLSGAQRTRLESRLAELEDSIKELPAETELRDLQQKMQAADYQLRDLAPQTSEIMQRANQTIETATLAEQGRRLEDLITRQRQFMTPPDLSSLVDREVGWRRTGIAPGLTNDELVRNIAEVEAAAKNAPPPPPTTPPSVPANWAQSVTEAATEAPKPAAATPAPQTEQATVAPADRLARAADIAKAEGSLASSRLQQEFQVGYSEATRLRNRLQRDGTIDSKGNYLGMKLAEKPEPMTFEQAYPDIDATKLSPAERDELMTAHREVEKATTIEDAYKQAGVCLRDGAG